MQTYAPAALRTLLPDDGPSDLHTYAVLDGARSDLIHPETLTSGRPWMILYAGALGPDLEAAAPRIVSLARDDAFSTWLLETGWADAWGIFARTRVDLGELKRHLRRFLMVKDEDGAQLYFRWYDPRVLRHYLPTCTLQELDYVFGPIEELLVEDEERDVLLRFRRDPAGRLQRQVIRLTPTAVAPPTPRPAPAAPTAPPPPAPVAAPVAPPPPPAVPAPTTTEAVAQLRELRESLRKLAGAPGEVEATQAAVRFMQGLLERLEAHPAPDPEGDALRKALRRAVTRVGKAEEAVPRTVSATVSTLLVTLKAY